MWKFHAERPTLSPSIEAGSLIPRSQGVYVLHVPLMKKPHMSYGNEVF